MFNLGFQSSQEVNIRFENTLDTRERSSVRAVNEEAFGGSEEADIVDGLYAQDKVLLSLVAELDQQVIGHVLFSRMWIDAGGGSIPAVALAPMAVLPGYQRRGIGQRLIRRGLDVLRERDERIVIVVGHPDYYPRFGFSSEKARSLESPFPADAFMAIELSPGALDEVRGKVRYPAVFGI